ncbi:MAG: carboxypeptidase regulatory-like domain-containing protein [Pyrinomonadaceae bacterium]|nr:carboxypeptidase regulatory-like domain-containing protein [Pyrinomonadaceae bacterium]
MRKILCSKSFVALLTIVLVSVVAYAQAGRSTVRGTIKDPQGNLVAGATVTLANAERNFTRTQTTSQEGTYVFTAVPPGTYSLEVEAQGFKKTAVSNVNALVDSSVDADVALEVGAVSETVNITSGGEVPLNTTDATIGVAFENRRIEQLPLNARNVVGLLSLQTGVTSAGYVNGGRADQANVTLDGVDVNEQQRGLDVVTDEAFASVLRSTPDSLQEFRVITTNPNAEQGRSSGAQVSLITKSGTNDWHGSLYHFHRNTITTSNDFFNNKDGVERPQLLRNIFGGSLGGPLKKDRAYFFFTYEGFREATATTVVREVPLPTLGQGIVRYFTASGASDGGCPAGTPAGVNCLTVAEINAGYNAANGVSPGVNPNALAVLAAAAAKYPANVFSGIGDGLNTAGFRFNSSAPSELNTYIGKLDFNLTDRQTLFVRGNYQQDLVTKANSFATDCTDSVQCFPDTLPLTIWNHPKGLAFGHTWTASQNVVNRFTYGFTRAAFTDAGDSTSNLVTFRFIFRPSGFSRTLSRVTPVHNFVEDLSWIRGNHTMQFGGNVRLISNNRDSFGAAFDSAITNPSFYDGSGAAVTRIDFGGGLYSGNVFATPANRTNLRDALTSVIGRFSQYSANLQYDANGALLATGSPSQRSFATQEYETYFQDSWRIRPSFTLTYGARWSTSTPVYEKNGVQVTPVQSLGAYFDQRRASALNGIPLNTPITLDKAGKANGRKGYYDQDWNNFAPSLAFAYSPDFGDGFFGSLLGRKDQSVIRGGFRMTYDRIGSQLAVNFDLNSSLGFSSSQTVAANTFNVSDRQGPLFTGFNANPRTFPFLAGNLPTQLNFPLTTPSDEAQRIESSLDDTLTTPYNYSVNLSYGRELGRGLSFETSYVGRFANKLLASRDIMHLNNLRDPQSQLTWYEAINKLIDHRYANTPISQVPTLPYFENLFPGAANFILGDPSLTNTQAVYILLARAGTGMTGPCTAIDPWCGFDITDYTFIQVFMDDQPVAKFPNSFFHPQYAALSTFGTIARSNYNSAQFSLRQRFRNDVTFDLNYTYSHSLDNASGLQASTSYGTAFIVNALDPDSNYASSDFDTRHIINANWLVGIPFGRGKRFGSDWNSVANTILGGWQTTGIFRWNTGLPTGEPFQADRWATNWNVQSNMVRVCKANSSPTRTGSPNLFADPLAVFKCFREPRAGEVGDRNILRGEGYFTLDVGMSKTFKMPWEGHSVQFRTEVFNLTNTQRFANNSLVGFGLPVDPFALSDADARDAMPTNFGQYTATQTPLNETKSGRIVQFALRYQF